MSRDDKYFQFPIKALKLATVERSNKVGHVSTHEAIDALNRIVSWSLLDSGRRQYERDELKAAGMFERYDSDIRDDGDQGDAFEWAVVGACLSNINCGRTMGRIKRDANGIDKIHGGGTLCRVRTDIFFDALQGAMSWRDFSVLCAIYGALGSNKWRIISYAQIGSMALGFCKMSESPQVVEALGLTRHQLRWTVGKLAKRGLFFVVPVDRRHNAYSVSLHGFELIDAVAKFKLAKNSKSITSRNKLDLVVSRMKTLKETGQWKPAPPKPRRNPGDPPIPPQRVPTTLPTRVPTDSPLTPH